MADDRDRLKRYTYTVPEAAQILGISERTIYRRLEGQGDLAEIVPGIPAIRVGRRWVVPIAPLHAALGETTGDTHVSKSEPEPPVEPGPTSEPEPLSEPEPSLEPDPPQPRSRLRARIERPRTIMRVTIYRERE